MYWNVDLNEKNTIINIASVCDSSSYVHVTMSLYIEATQEEYIFTDQSGSVDPMVGDTAS